MYLSNTNDLIKLAKQNICQLLVIGLQNSDEQIEKHFGGEDMLLNVTKGYLKLAEDLMKLKESEDK